MNLPHPVNRQAEVLEAECLENPGLDVVREHLAVPTEAACNAPPNIIPPFRRDSCEDRRDVADRTDAANVANRGSQAPANISIQPEVTSMIV
jgi:hypothetical protein